ncbi:uncharacterized protein LOC116196061 [Punica granatum]|uniref:Uncharacterized protein LOC116196061 n=1 Tax=Punica granatum TaxID=22663 RepID=A0A6P8CJ64_PUNGR|nr:uncharacterized protein LOC116196061 [Punica granatum]
MYADTGLMFPCFQNLYQEAQQFDDFCKPQKPNASLSKLFQSSTIMEYDLGGEGDLFKAPEPIIEEPIIGLDPMAAAISMISCGEDSILAQDLKVADIASLQNEPLFSEVFYDCRKDLLEKAATEATFSEALQIKIPPLKIDENQSVVNELTLDLPFQKSVSSGCLSSIQGAALKPNFLGFSGLDFGAVYGMRRAFSEGDIKTLSNGNNGNGNGNGDTSLIHSPLERPILISNCTSEERKEKLSRYRNKKTKRNFGRKIKYACRKALADSQPRIRGRFAKTEESDISKKQ